MNSKDFPSFIKNVFKEKKLMIIGIIGIILIGISSFSPFSSEEEKAEIKTTDPESYRLQTQEQIKSVVIGITGNKDVKVAITLERGSLYEYESERQENISEGDSIKREESTKTTTVQKGSGSEDALIITEYMPQIRGVAIVCKGIENSAVKEEIANAVAAALGITSKRVYIAQWGGN